MLATERAARLVRRLPPARGTVGLAWRWKRVLERNGQLDGAWRIATRDGMVLELPAASSMTWAVAFAGAWDAPFVEFLAPYVAPDSLVLDVGASLGLWTVPLARQARSAGARVWAYEPIPKNVRWLLRNVALNDLSHVVDVRRRALGAAPGQLPMLLTDAGGGNAVVPMDDRSDAELVPVARLDDEPLPLRVSLIKLDVEGYELEVLRGARGLLEQDRPVVFGEFSRAWLRERGEDLAVFLRMMTELDYSVFELRRQRSRAWRQVDRIGPLPVDPRRPVLAENLVLLPRGA